MSEKKSFFKHFMVIGTGTLFNMVLGLITTPLLTRLVSPTEYGKISMFNTYTSIAVMIFCLGLDQALVRFYYEKDDLPYKRALLKFCLVIPIVLAFCASIITIILSVINGKLLDFEPIIIAFLCTNIIVSLWNRMALLVLRLNYQSKKYALSNFMHRLVYLIVAVVLILTFRSRYFILLAFATWFSLTVSSVIAVVMSRDCWKFSDVSSSLKKTEIIKYSLPFILSMGLTTVFQACDKLAIKHFCSFAEVGIYASALTMIAVFAIVQTTFNTLWSPMMINHLVNSPKNTSFIRVGNKYITIIMFSFGLLLILFKDVFVLLLGQKYREAAYIMPFLIFNPIMYTISETTQAGIEYSKKSYLNVFVSLAACIFNILGNAILVPVLGGKGAAISTGLSYVVFFFMRTILSQRYYPVDFEIWKIIVMIILTSVFATQSTFDDFKPTTILFFLLCFCTLLTLYMKDVKGLYRYTRKEIYQMMEKNR